MGAHHVAIFEYKRLFFSFPTKWCNRWTSYIPVSPLRAKCWKFSSTGRISSAFVNLHALNKPTATWPLSLAVCGVHLTTAIILWMRKMKAWRTNCSQKNSSGHLLEFIKKVNCNSQTIKILKFWKRFYFKDLERHFDESIIFIVVHCITLHFTFDICPDGRVKLELVWSSIWWVKTSSRFSSSSDDSI